MYHFVFTLVLSEPAPSVLSSFSYKQIMTTTYIICHTCLFLGSLPISEGLDLEKAMEIGVPPPQEMPSVPQDASQSCNPPPPTEQGYTVVYAVILHVL